MRRGRNVCTAFPCSARAEWNAAFKYHVREEGRKKMVLSHTHTPFQAFEEILVPTNKWWEDFGSQQSHLQKRILRFLWCQINKTAVCLVTHHDFWHGWHFPPMIIPRKTVIHVSFFFENYFMSCKTSGSGTSKNTRGKKCASIGLITSSPFP